MNIADTELVRLLEDRDGPIPARSWPHSSEGECKYSQLYEGKACPWCEAERRRRQQDLGVPMPPTPAD